MINLFDILACPKCGYTFSKKEDSPLSWIYCRICNKFYSKSEGIPILLEFPDGRKEYSFEILRYNRIARDAPKEWKLDETHPETRALILKNLIGNIPIYLNIGAGFGQMEATMPEKDKVCLDQSIEFLNVLRQKQIPNVYPVCGFAERMPFKSEAFPCVVSDSTFQTVVDQKEFLFECARVLKKDGLFLMATHYRWNYPRKPQMFPVKDPELLLRFLHEVGIEADIRVHNLERGKTFPWIHENPELSLTADAYQVTVAEFLVDADYFVVSGKKVD